MPPLDRTTENNKTCLATDRATISERATVMDVVVSVASSKQDAVDWTAVDTQVI